MWRTVAIAVPMLALAALQCAHAADEPVKPAATEAKAVLAPAAQPAETAVASWGTGLLAPLREFGVESWWDVPRFGQWTGTTGLSFDGQAQRLSSPGSPSQQTSNMLATEGLSIRNDGFVIVDPRLFSATIAAGFALQQQRQRTDLFSSSQNGTLNNYSFDGTFLPESPYSLNLFAVRTQSTYVLPSSTTTNSDNQFEGLAFRLRESSWLRDKEILPYFSANLLAQQQHTRQTTFTGPQVFRQDDQNELVSFDFSNGGETSDLNFQYQLKRLTNYVYAPGSYDSQSASLVYSLDFGPTLNRRWDSRINYYSRVGQSYLSDFNNLEVNEFLTIDHNTERSSAYNYQLTRQASPFGTSTSQLGYAQIQQQIYSNLSVTAAVNGLYTSLPVGTISSTGGTANLNYSRALPWDGQLTLNGGAGDLFTTSKVPGGAVQVRDAAYVVPPVISAGSGILLADRNIVTASIVVVVIKGALRVQAVVDVDYTVQVIGDRTRIFPLASSAVMLPGDLLNISYVYNVPPDATYRTTSRSFFVGADWPWIGFNYSHDETVQTPLEGSSDSLLLDQRRDAGAIWVGGNWNEYRGRVSVSVVNYDSTRLSYLETRSDQYLSYQPYLNLQFNLAASQYWTDYQFPTHTTTGSSVRLDVTWTWWGNWISSAYAGTRAYTDTSQPSEKIDEAGFRLRRTWSLLDLNVFGGMQRRTRGNVSSVSEFLHLAAIRRF